MEERRTCAYTRYMYNVHIETYRARDTVATGQPGDGWEKIILLHTHIHTHIRETLGDMVATGCVIIARAGGCSRMYARANTRGYRLKHRFPPLAYVYFLPAWSTRARVHLPTLRGIFRVIARCNYRRTK